MAHKGSAGAEPPRRWGDGSMVRPSTFGTIFQRAFAALVLLVASSSMALAQDDAAEAWVQDLADRGIGILGDPALSQDDIIAEFQDLLVENAALRQFGRSVLGAYSRDLTDEEFEQYIELLEQYASSVVRSRLDQYSGETLTVTDSTVNERSSFAYVSVDSDVRNVDNEHLAGVRWLLVRRDGDYRVYDITVEAPAEVGTFSLRQTQQEEFTSAITQSDGRARSILRYLRNRIREQGMEPANEREPS